MNKLVIESVAILGLAFLGASCIMAVGAQNAASRPTPAPVAQVAIATPAPKPAATATEVPAAAAVEAPTLAPPVTEPTIAPTATSPRSKPEVKPTVPPPPSLAVAFTGRFEPMLLRVGQKLVVELTLENKSERPIEGLRIFSRGPWDKYTIVNVMPNGRHESGMLGHNFYSGLVFPPGVKRTVNIVAYPNEPGNHEFSFIPNAGTTALKDEKGEGIVIGGKVNVTR